MVTFPSNGGTANGYLASPASGGGPGVVVIQEWWGLNEQIKGVADMLASRGYNALAPDFFHGRVAGLSEPNVAQKLMMEFFQANTAAKDAKGAAEFLAKHPKTTSGKVGVIGFCLGGHLALLTASVASEYVSAVVDCYGGSDPPDLEPLASVAVLGIFGGKDHGAGPAVVEKIRTGLEKAGAKNEFKSYPQADHAFLNEQRPEVYRKEDAEDAWRRILAFFGEHIR